MEAGGTRTYWGRVLQRHKAQKNTSLPFCQEVQGLQRGSVQGQDSNVHRDHWWGGILQRERLDLKDTRPKIYFISFRRPTDISEACLKKYNRASYLALVDGRRTKVQRQGRLCREPRPPKEKKKSVICDKSVKVKWNKTSGQGWRLRVTCRAACLCCSASESRAPQPVYCPPSKTRRRSLGGGNAATRCDLEGVTDA